MTTVHIENDIKIYNMAQSTKGKICDELIISNPEFQKKRAMGLPIWGVPKEIKLYEQKNDCLVIPRGFIRELQRYIPDALVYNNALMLPKVEFNSKIQLRDYQEPAVNHVKTQKQGIIVMPCGAGKTQTGLQVIAEIQQPALWITHTRDLLNQSMQRAKDNFSLEAEDIGIIAGNTCKIGNKITFGMVQTLANRDLTDIKNKFGLIIIDECHHCFKDSKALGQFYSVISQFPALYRIGITASEHRSDGLIKTMYLTIGPKIYEVTQEQLMQTGNVITPRVEFIQTAFTFEDPDGAMINFAQMRKAMENDNQRNLLLIRTILNQRENNSILVLGDSLEHLEYIQKVVMYSSNKLKTAFINGQTPKHVRETALKKMRDHELNILFATYALAKEGLDIPRLDRLFLLTPKRDKVIIQQSVGRIMRPAAEKQGSIVYDFYDIQQKTCYNQARERAKVYRSLGCEIIGGPVYRGKKNKEQEMLNTLKIAF